MRSKAFIAGNVSRSGRQRPQGIPNSEFLIPNFAWPLCGPGALTLADQALRLRPHEVAHVEVVFRRSSFPPLRSASE